MGATNWDSLVGIWRLPGRLSPRRPQRSEWGVWGKWGEWWGTGGRGDIHHQIIGTWLSRVSTLTDSSFLDSMHVYYCLSAWRTPVPLVRKMICFISWFQVRSWEVEMPDLWFTSPEIEKRFLKIGVEIASQLEKMLTWSLKQWKEILNNYLKLIFPKVKTSAKLELHGEI